MQTLYTTHRTACVMQRNVVSQHLYIIVCENISLKACGGVLRIYGKEKIFLRHQQYAICGAAISLYSSMSLFYIHIYDAIYFKLNIFIFIEEISTMRLPIFNVYTTCAV